MKHLLLFSSCATYYPTRRTYGGCDRVIDIFNYIGGPVSVIFLLVLVLVLVRAVGWLVIKKTNKK